MWLVGYDWLLRMGMLSEVVLQFTIAFLHLKR